ncbi:MAG TPA: DUF2807 domain-containing protein [Haliangiales bacterium]|nr:DUF2807 domain-containing protein [Haliangiales bacterium]
MYRIVVLGVLISSSAFAGGKVVDESRQVGDFTGVHVGSGIQARVETGARGPIALRGDEEVLKHVRTQVKGSVLTIDIDWDRRETSTDIPTTVTVRLPSATSLGVSGGAQMDASVPAAEELEIHASGGGRLKLSTVVQTKRFLLDASGGSGVTLAGVQAGTAELHLSGGSRSTLSGRADSARAALSGAATLDAAGLQVDTLDVGGSGHARAEIRALKSVRGSLSGGSRVRVPAAADVRVGTSGGAAVTQDL